MPKLARVPPLLYLGWQCWKWGHWKGMALIARGSQACSLLLYGAPLCARLTTTANSPTHKSTDVAPHPARLVLVSFFLILTFLNFSMKTSTFLTVLLNYTISTLYRIYTQHIMHYPYHPSIHDEKNLNSSHLQGISMCISFTSFAWTRCLWCRACSICRTLWSFVLCYCWLQDHAF